MGKRSFPLNAGRVRVILCSEPLRKTRPESFLFSPPRPYLPSPPLPVIYAGLGSWPQATLFPQLSSSWELVQMNTPMPAVQSSFLTQLFLIYDLHLATVLSYQFLTNVLKLYILMGCRVIYFDTCIYCILKSIQKFIISL